jgi:hypothetical protein
MPPRPARGAAKSCCTTVPRIAAGGSEPARLTSRTERPTGLPKPANPHAQLTRAAGTTDGNPANYGAQSHWFHRQRAALVQCQSTVRSPSTASSRPARHPAHRAGRPTRHTNSQLVPAATVRPHGRPDPRVPARPAAHAPGSITATSPSTPMPNPSTPRSAELVTTTSTTSPGDNYRAKSVTTTCACQR